MDRYVLVVMEHTSEWPTHVNGGAAGCVVLRQEPNESPGELVRRTYVRIRAIERIGGVVEVAVLSCSDDASVGALEGRVPLARTLLATVLHAENGRLELVARESAQDRVRHSLMGLAGTLTEALRGKSASVSAQFSGGSAFAPPPRTRRTSRRTVDDGRSAA